MPTETDDQTQPGTMPVVLDTDIGTDVDDLLAGEPRVDLCGVTTVHAGTEEPQSGRKIWWAGHEGRGIDDLDDEQFSGVAAVDALVDAARHTHGELVVVAIGPLTNIAEALDRDPEWADAFAS